MARGKKKETLTPEDRLQAALVPESEQPYKVPENWCWVKVGDLCTFIGGGTPDKTNPLYWNGNMSWASVKDIKGSYLYSTIDKISQLGLESSSSNLCEAGDLLLVTRIEPAKAIVSKIVTAINQDLKIVKSELSSLFLYYYFCAFQHEFEKKASGSTVKGITLPNIQNTPFPLPPLPEQQRIVDRIESLFAKLDEAKQKAQDALDSFESRKAAILHKAFNGELTAQWRKEHGVGMESWENVSVSEICHSLKYGTAKKSSSEGTVVVIRMGNLQDGEISWGDLAFSNDEEDIEKYKLIPGDVLFNRTNSPALVGKTSIYRGEYPAIYAGYLIKLDYDRSRVIGDYLNYSLNTVSAKEYCNSVKTDGVNQSNINAKKIGAYRFDMPKVNEQTEIVRILDDLLAKEQQAKEAAEGVLEQIDLIKKAILARAFRGELGTNDPNEESAVELVRHVLQEN